MDRYPSTVVSTSRASALTTNKVLRNTYLLLGATLAFSAAMAGVAMALNLPYFGLFTLLGYFGLLFAVHKTRNSGWGIVWTFALTGFMGLTLGPILDFYLKALPNGSQLVMTSLGITARGLPGIVRVRGQEREGLQLPGRLPGRRRHRRVRARPGRLLLPPADAVAGGVRHVRAACPAAHPVADERDHPRRRDELHPRDRDAVRRHLQHVPQPAAPAGRGDDDEID